MSGRRVDGPSSFFICSASGGVRVGSAAGGDYASDPFAGAFDEYAEAGVAEVEARDGAAAGDGGCAAVDEAPGGEFGDLGGEAAAGGAEARHGVLAEDGGLVGDDPGFVFGGPAVGFGGGHNDFAVLSRDGLAAPAAGGFGRGVGHCRGFWVSLDFIRRVMPARVEPRVMSPPVAVSRVTPNSFSASRAISRRSRESMPRSTRVSKGVILMLSGTWRPAISCTAA